MKPRNNNLPLAGSILVGQGTSLDKTGGSFREQISHGASVRHANTMQEQTRKDTKARFNELAKISLKRGIKPSGGTNQHYESLLTDKLGKAALF